MIDDIAWDGTRPTGNQMLEGFTPKSVDAVAKAAAFFIKKCKQSADEVVQVRKKARSANRDACSDSDDSGSDSSNS